MKRLLTITFLITICALIACKQETVLNQEDILGNWIIAGAKRDGKPTVMLQNVYFKISADSIKTNLNATGEDVSSPYSIKGTAINQSDQVVYDVTGISDTTLLISTSLMGRDFEMLFLRTD